MVCLGLLNILSNLWSFFFLLIYVNNAWSSCSYCCGLGGWVKRGLFIYLGWSAVSIIHKDNGWVAMTLFLGRILLGFVCKGRTHQLRGVKSAAYHNFWILVGIWRVSIRKSLTLRMIVVKFNSQWIVICLLNICIIILCLVWYEIRFTFESLLLLSTLSQVRILHFINWSIFWLNWNLFYVAFMDNDSFLDGRLASTYVLWN